MFITLSLSVEEAAALKARIEARIHPELREKLERMLPTFQASLRAFEATVSPSPKTP